MPTSTSKLNGRLIYVALGGVLAVMGWSIKQGFALTVDVAKISVKVEKLEEGLGEMGKVVGENHDLLIGLTGSTP